MFWWHSWEAERWGIYHGKDFSDTSHVKRQAAQVNELAWLIETGNAEAAFNEDIQVADVKGMWLTCQRFPVVIFTWLLLASLSKVVLNVWSLPSTSKNEKSYIVVWAPGKKASVCLLLNKLPRRAFECNHPTDFSTAFFSWSVRWKTNLLFKHLNLQGWYPFFSIPAQLVFDSGMDRRDYHVSELYKENGVGPAIRRSDFFPRATDFLENLSEISSTAWSSSTEVALQQLRRATPSSCSRC